ncbi:hypothetical protein A2631_05985 [Candidatus Daviesbacteria bacterium RIFCSPHIGHO2_01_FULL_44_29]|uniref:Uncharacterized protein n=1 Tax=Candidatus Daviesbacteria bacterium RIFCSPHIGHO2_02_FULL_43_12 TaxID=1797776 RepID=A0A1F5KJG3_9BACT|nr:MAG: hypothetical protein A2631_05985 [Candidatus Daviesbacteria bacterium RIFCSPHIGHO2_01_FULL_44_29]OGE39143.1 MAG: hypothetical protein A3E86_03315 [Candidatus Daviesbacteria bacterium RIFCSPHIGHO2_12_FULL_47_45]OGE40945.1 MAG: hypothetical protein A3D25_02815 [Candidatus Daviesbacteria bacterium RIFCSPHIGHO2_02_FULL_43_12]OGE69904.1 MAG: hypothetical protein A3B55_05855 [Candidatus Daviesbacteria bacterium RIFCSPLOWO2_01_FULL_43_15]
MDKLLTIFNKYPWVAIVILMHWIATSFVLIYASETVNVAQVMGLSFLSTIVYAYIGFKVPKG